MSTRAALAHLELHAVFGAEFLPMTATDAALLCGDVIDIADEEEVSIGKAANILYTRVGVGGLLTYASCLRAGARRKKCDDAVERAKREILADVESGRVPRTAKDFSELHDYVDANEYGGLCEDGWLDGTDIDDDCVIVNTVQGRIDSWIKKGGLTK